MPKKTIREFKREESFKKSILLQPRLHPATPKYLIRFPLRKMPYKILNFQKRTRPILSLFPSTTTAATATEYRGENIWNGRTHDGNRAHNRSNGPPHGGHTNGDGAHDNPAHKVKHAHDRSRDCGNNVSHCMCELGVDCRWGELSKKKSKFHTRISCDYRIRASRSLEFKISREFGISKNFWTDDGVWQRNSTEDRKGGV